VRRIALEPLENRRLLASAPVNVFAEFDGVIASPGSSTTLKVNFTSVNFSLPNHSVILGFHLEASAGSALVPAPVQVTPASTGASVTAIYVAPKVASGTGSLSVDQLSYGTYQLTLPASPGTSGAYHLDVYLVGDADGNRSVDSSDGTIIKAIYGSKVGDGVYQIAADSNLDGLITSFDLAEWRLNYGNTTSVNPLAESSAVSPAPVQLPGGALATNNPNVNVTGTTNPGATVALETGTDSNFDEGSTTADTSGHFSLPVTLSPGANSISVRSTDSFGQQRIVSISVYLDTQAPGVSIHSPGAGLATHTNVEISGQVIDDVSGVATLQAQVETGLAFPDSFDGSGNFSFSTALPLDGSADGVQTVQLVGADRVGNVSAPVGISFILDTRAPTVSFQGATSGLLTRTNMNISGQADDTLSGVASVSAQLDGGASFPVTFDASGNFHITSQLPLNGSADGTHVLHVTATDAAGNTSQPSAFSFALDATPPAITVTSPQAGLAFAHNITLSGHVDDNLSGVAGLQMALDGGTYSHLPVDASETFNSRPRSHSMAPPTAGTRSCCKRPTRPATSRA
jgi:hypothetical protein